MSVKKFESVIIVKPTIADEDSILYKYNKLIKDNGILEKIDKLGKKKLAYEIKGYKEGIYIVFYFNSDFELVKKLEEEYRKDDNVIKFITVRMGD